MTFASDLSRFSEKVGIRMDTVVRKVGFDLMRDLVKLTPVDTGLARSSYFAGYTRNSGRESTASKNGAPSLARAAAFTSTLKAGGIFYITNNLPYILQITQYGTSTQAAPGSLTTLTANWQNRINRIVGVL